jgi:hypothetical protein
VGEVRGCEFVCGVVIAGVVMEVASGCD